MTRYLIFLMLFLGINHASSQDKYKLPKALNEISGLEKFNDSVLIAINDSGNSPDIYFINLKGNILKKCRVTNALNYDWEDLTMDDKGNLFIADVGNNLNDRKNLCILKLNAKAAFQNDSISVEKIFFSYVGQRFFPPKASSCKYNCEAIYWKNDSLHLITKNESKNPKNSKRKIYSDWNRYPEDYVISDKPGVYMAQQNQSHIDYLHKVSNKGILDLVTSIDYENGMIAILTYSEIRTFRINENNTITTIEKGWGTKHFKKLAQREALVIFSDKLIYIATEKHPLLGGPFIYKKAFE
ncbi:MAG: hypothetical protein RI883_467 [Bacteroidota bacterium]